MRCVVDSLIQFLMNIFGIGLLLLLIIGVYGVVFAVLVDIIGAYRQWRKEMRNER